MCNCNFLEYVGGITLCFVGFRVLSSLFRGLYYSFLGSIVGLSPKFKNLGKWAVVTGSTDGIGKAYAHELARCGMDVVLISRSPYRLQNVAVELETQYKVKTKIIDVDFTGGMEIYERIQSELKGLEIGVLVNNVGMSYDQPEYFLDVPSGEECFHKLIMCNILSVTMMTKMILPQMVERRKGVVLNMSSISGKFPMPLLAVYSGVKSYVNFFSLALNREYKNSGVIIQSIIPSLVTSKLSKARRTAFNIPDPTQFVRGQMRTIGLVDQTPGYWSHNLMVYLMEILQIHFPTFALPKVLMDQMTAMRKKALIRLEREKNKQQ